MKTKWGELFKLYFAHGFSWLGIQTMFVYSFAFLEQKMSSMSALPKADRDLLLGQIIGWSFFILNAVGSIWPVFLLGPLSKRIGRVRTHIIMVLMMSLGYFGIVLFARDTWTLLCYDGDPHLWLGGHCQPAVCYHVRESR